MRIRSEKMEAHKQRNPRVVEIIGPAGAGKTTLYNEFNRYHDRIQLSNFPDVRKFANVPFFIAYGLQLTPTLLRISQSNDRQLNRREFAWLTILRGWPTALQKELKKNNRVIVLDQGPVYLLAEMSEFGPEYLGDPKAALLWRDLYSRWANILDMVVWLDAEDHDLVKRIRSRDKDHVMKNESVETIFKFLDCYRNAYKRIISNLLTNCPNIEIVRFDTSRVSSEEIADQLLLEFGQTSRPLRTPIQASSHRG
jgi:hypothetical protein